MSKIGEQLVVVALAIVGLAGLAVIVSNNASTSSIIGTTSTAFNNALNAALRPVTGTGGSLG